MNDDGASLWMATGSLSAERVNTSVRPVCVGSGQEGKRQRFFQVHRLNVMDASEQWGGGRLAPRQKVGVKEYNVPANKEQAS
jgi:hypothetical protein